MIAIINKLFEIFILIFGILIVWFFCNIACQLRNYSFGHRFVKAFVAENSFQRAFTILHRWFDGDIDSLDLNKITYIGFFNVIICIIIGIVVIPFSLITYFFNHSLAIWTYLYWCGGCFLLSLLAFFLQVIDSVLNAILRYFNK